MKYLKTYEKSVNTNLTLKLEEFFQKYKEFKESWKYEDTIKMAKNIVPKTFFEEFTILYFLYTNDWKYSNDKSENDFIKKEIKKNVLKTIFDKFNDISNYFLLKTYLEKNKNLTSLNYNRTIKNILFLFNSSIRKSELKNIQKYNL